MPIVVDASALLAVAFGELVPMRAGALFARIASETALAPPVFPVEIANGLEVGRRRSQIDAPTIGAFLADLGLLPIAIQRHLEVAQIQGLRAYAERHGLTAYDASYLHLAQDQTLELITLDAALERAAQQAGVKVSQP